MHPRAAEFRDRVIEELGVDLEVHELPEGTRTAQDAADAAGCRLSQISKSMVMDVDDELVLVLTSGPNRVDEEALAEALGVEADTVAPASPDSVKETLGWSIGGVPPFVHDTAVETYIDPDLLEHKEVWSGAGTPKAVFPIDPASLKELTSATVIEVFTDG